MPFIPPQKGVIKGVINLAEVVDVNAFGSRLEIKVARGRSTYKLLADSEKIASDWSTLIRREAHVSGLSNPLNARVQELCATDTAAEDPLYAEYGGFKFANDNPELYTDYDPAGNAKEDADDLPENYGVVTPNDAVPNSPGSKSRPPPPNSGHHSSKPVAEDAGYLDQVVPTGNVAQDAGYLEQQPPASTEVGGDDKSPETTPDSEVTQAVATEETPAAAEVPEETPAAVEVPEETPAAAEVPEETPAATEEPAAVEDPPAGAEDPPAVTEETPATTEEMPAATEEPTAVTTEQPTASDDDPAAEDTAVVSEDSATADATSE